MLSLVRSETEYIDGQMFIGGEWRAASKHRVIEVFNPASEAVIGTVPEATEQDAQDAIESAHAAWQSWAMVAPVQRAQLVSKLARLVDAHRDALAYLVTREQGKPLSQAKGEIAAVSMFLDFAAESARRIEGDLLPSENPGEEIQIRRHPYGVVVALTAWNYPAALAARKVGPALVAGNSVVLLAHENTPFSGLALAQLAEQAGFPKGVFNVVTGRGRVAGQAMVEHPSTGLVTMTGSTRAGREIYRSAADSIRVIRLELGGKAPFIVMDDADVDAAVEAAVAARYTNCGQICTCNERMYVHEAIADEFIEKFIRASEALTIGDPLTDVDLGPKISAVERDKVADLVERSVTAGAEVLLEGGPLGDGAFARGYWYSPTVLSVTDNQVPAVRDEVFGPVAVIRRITSFDEAIELANDTQFGLSAYLFTRDHERLMQAPYLLKFGELYLNRSNGESVQGFHTGWGLSGLGGEDGKYGFDGYMRKQTSYLNWARQTARE